MAVTLTPTSGWASQVITLSAKPTSVLDFSTCTLTGPSGVISNAVVKVFGGTAYGSFTVGTGPGAPGGGAYTLTLTCGSDSGTASFTVLPSITITPSIGGLNAFAQVGGIQVTGVGFPSDAATCTITGGLIVPSGQPCTINSPAGTVLAPFGQGCSSCFGTYTITVQANLGSPATGTFQFVNTPTLSVNPTDAVPGYGTAGVGSRVMITGGDFAIGTCTSITPASGLVFAGSSCSVDQYGTLTASFGVDPTSTPGTTSFTIKDNGGNTVTTSFKVDAAPTGTLNVASGPPGTLVQVTAGVFASTTFTKLDAGPCLVSSTPPGLVLAQFCAIDNTGHTLGVVNARFLVDGVAIGAYQVTIIGAHGDSASAGTFTLKSTVTGGLNPTFGSPPLGALPGTTLTLLGSGFLATDNTCSIDPTTPNIIANFLCTITNGQLSASFTVAAGATFGTYALTVRGQPSGIAAIATVNFNVVPRIILSPIVGVSTTTVSISGSGFGAGPLTPCFSLTSTPTNLDPSMGTPPTGPATCTVNADGTLTGSFVVGSVANGVYKVTVIGIGLLDSASADFDVGAVGQLTVSPLSGNTGATVTVSDFTSGFANPKDNGACTISVSPGSNLISTLPTCTISSGSVATFSFTVAPNAQGGTWAITVTGSTGDFETGFFTVVPQINLTPSLGPIGTLVTISGSGFAAADAGSCAVTLFSTPANLFSGLTCVISGTTFQMSGSFTVAPSALTQAYLVTFPGSLGDTEATYTVTPFSTSSLGGAISSIYSSSLELGFEVTTNTFDNLGAGYMIGHRSPPKVTFVFTDSTRVNTGTHQLLFSPDYSNAVVVAGPLANPTTAFYEKNGFTPLTFSLSGGNAIFKQGATTVFSVPMASLSSTNDYFIMEAFNDGSHTVVVLYGINAPGTLASGVYFDSHVFPSLGGFTASAYIIHWQGTTPDVPFSTDTYTTVYHT
jgi:hypothetical protein